jgi:Tol biopolymer transport system component
MTRSLVFAQHWKINGDLGTPNVMGANVRLIANTEGRGTAPRWSPDGKTIYFTNCVEINYGTDCEIFMARSDPQPLKAN